MLPQKRARSEASQPAALSFQEICIEDNHITTPRGFLPPLDGREMISLDLLRLIASYLEPSDRRNLKQTSWAWYYGVWHGLRHIIVHNLEGFIRISTALAPYELDSPVILEFRCDVRDTGLVNLKANLPRPYASPTNCLWSDISCFNVILHLTL